jgi:hypothetical protein
LILLPLTLAANVPGGWHNNTMRGMLAGGLVLFPIFCWYETKFPRLPLVPYRFLRNKSILGACLIGESFRWELVAMILIPLCNRLLRFRQLLPSVYQPLQLYLRHARLVVPESDIFCVMPNIISDGIRYRRRNTDGQVPRCQGTSLRPKYKHLG